MSTAQSTSVLDEIRTRGHWSVAIHPGAFDEGRVRHEDLFSIINSKFVNIRGRNYPYVNQQKQILRGTNWIGQEHAFDKRIETWRFHTSGLFAQYFAMLSDWRDRSIFRTADTSWQWGQDLYYLDTIYQFVEIFEFAARLAQSAAGDGQMHVEIAIKRLQGRRLVSEDIHFPLDGDYATEMPNWPYQWIGMQTELMARPRELAAQATRDLFIRFGLNISLDDLRRLQIDISR